MENLQCRTVKSKLRLLGRVSRMGEEQITETSDDINEGGQKTHGQAKN